MIDLNKRSGAVRLGFTRLAAAAVALALLLFCFPAPGTRAEEPKVIRVGYPDQKRLTEINEDGSYSGYTYEFLQEIAQFTGWEYEFVRVPGSVNESLSAMLTMLEKGELDLLGGMTYSETLAGIFDYPATSYGNIYTTIAVLNENTSVNEANYQSLDNLRIAIMESSKVYRQRLENFYTSNDISAELVPCETEEDMLSSLRAGTVDAVLSNDAQPFEGMRVVARFSPQPFYFASTKGNSEVISALNSAMAQLNDSDPYFIAGLYEKYFISTDRTLRFNDAETAYLEQAPKLRVAVSGGQMPLEGLREDGRYYGVSADLLDYVQENTGLSFEMIQVGSAEEQMKYLRDGKADLAPGLAYDYVNAQKYGFSLTKPYLSSQIVMVVREGIDPYQLSGKRLALTHNLGYEGEFMGQVTWYDSVEQCLERVHNGEADYTYGNSHSVQYYTGENHYQDLMMIPQSNYINQYCIGVSHPVDTRLLTIINKTIRSIPEEELQAIIYQNATLNDTEITVADLIRTNPFEALAVLVVIMLLVAAFFAWIAWSQKRAGRRLRFENERYQLLADISGEYLFEYDFIEDRLKLNEKTAKYFDVEAVLENYFAGREKVDDLGRQAMETVNQRIRKEKNLVLEHKFLTRDGEITWWRITATALFDKSGNPSYLIGKLINIQEERQEREELSQKALSDSLTGLYNSAAIRDFVSEALNSAGDDEEGTDEKRPSGTLIILDIDHFKAVNDRCGHYTGDRVLQDVSAILSSTFRQGERIGRLGGDEFVVYMGWGDSREAVEQKCGELQERVRVRSGEWPYPITLSIGAAIVYGPILYDEFYRLADNALYEAKNAGRNTFRITEQ